MAQYFKEQMPRRNDRRDRCLLSRIAVIFSVDTERANGQVCAILGNPAERLKGIQATMRKADRSCGMRATVFPRSGSPGLFDRSGISSEGPSHDRRQVAIPRIRRTWFRSNNPIGRKVC